MFFAGVHNAWNAAKDVASNAIITSSIIISSSNNGCKVNPAPYKDTIPGQHGQRQRAQSGNMATVRPRKARTANIQT
jgi:hypothetical protein